MKHPHFSPFISALAAAFGDGLRVRWTDGRVFVLENGKWRKE